MAYEFKLPDIGEGVVEGEIVKWLVKEGDAVAEDQPLVEVMTDKATVTIPSPKKGTILKRFVDEGGVAKVHEPLVSIETADAAPVKAAAPAPVAASVATVPATVSTAVSAPAPAAESRVLATPVTRRIAREHGIPLTDLTGSGPDGRILKKDVLAVVESRTVAPVAVVPAAIPAPLPVPEPVAIPSPAVAASDTRMPVRGLRKAIWKKMVQSEQFAVPFTYVDEVDVTELVALRERLNAKAAARGGAKLTFLPFIVKATIAALRKYPNMNASVDEEKQELIVRSAYNIGIGVATDAGLTVAVVHEADKRSLQGVASELDRLGKAARDNKLSVHDLSGSTFTISSLGKDGGMFATPVINHPEVGIIGIHKIEARPVVVDRQIVIRDRMYLSCSFDHRIIDGHMGAAFVADIKRYLEDPDLLMVEAL